MKKIKKTLAVLLTLILLLGLCLCLTGCSVDPYALDIWYLTGYTDENEEIHNVGYNTIKQEILYSDDITIQYFEDGTFIFKEFDKEYTGTYTYKSGRKESSVALTFSDGTKGNGTCAKYMFDGVWYVGTLQVFGKEYSFAEDCREENMSERYDSPYTHVGESITEMLKSGKTEIYGFYHSSSYTLYQGEIELRGEEYWFVPNNLEKAEKNLSQAYELYTYEVAEDGSVQRGDNILREGKCFINYNVYRVRLDSENTETRYEYAVWYQEGFSKIFPWTVGLKQEDILSVRAESKDVRNLLHGVLYEVQIWEQGSNKLEEFYNLLLNSQSIVSEVKFDYIHYQMTYHIKTSEQTYTLVLQDGYSVDNGGYKCFVVNGQYYRICSEKRLATYFIENAFYALDKGVEDVKFFIGNQHIKSYDNLLENILFVDDVDYEKSSSKYVLKIGESTLTLLDEKHFIFQGYMGLAYYDNRYFEIVGDVDFSVIFEEYPLINES